MKYQALATGSTGLQPLLGGAPDSLFRTFQSISVVIPLYNEEGNVEELLRRVTATLARTGLEFEVICVDDGSRDRTFPLVQAMRLAEPRIRAIRFRANFGQTAALAAGFEAAVGDVVIAMDGDLQHIPEEIPNFLVKLDEGYDIVSGWRFKRVDNALLRRIPSRIANWTMARLSGLDIHDFGTTFKAYRGGVLRNVRLYGDFHRFIPALTSAMKLRVAEIPIENVNRRVGASNYGIKRTFTVFFDLIRVKIITQYLSRPLQFFGTAGSVMGLVAGVVLAYLVYAKLFQGIHIMEDRGPLLLLTMLTMIVGAQLFAVGILGEMLFKMYADLSGRPIYSVAQRLGLDGE